MIYTSPHPPVLIPDTSVFTHLFAPSQGGSVIGGHSSSLPAYIDADSGVTLTRLQTCSLALSLAYGLRTHLKLKRGDTVLIFSPNTLVWPVAAHAISAAGLRATLANSAYTSNELCHQWVDSGAKLAFVHPALVKVAFEALQCAGLSENESRKRLVVMGSKWLTAVSEEEDKEAKGLVRVEDLVRHGKMEVEEKFEGKQADETVFLCYSSGTTGKPKGVETTHKNMCSVLEIIKPVFPTLVPGRDVMLGVLPFYHIYGAVKLLHYPFESGIPVVIMPRFDPVKFCAHIARYRVTISLIVPPVLLALARHPAVLEHDLRSLSVLTSGAAPLSTSLLHAVYDRLKSVGADVAITQGYGLTETSPTTHLLPTGSALSKAGSVGVLLPNLEARLVDDDGVDVRAGMGERGELWIRGPSVMKGYLNNPTATDASITPDGWFKTGDVAIVDEDGYWTIVDRKKELIKYKGFQVPPAELESVLLQHPDVADAAVVGVDSVEEATELPRAYIVHASPSAVPSPAAQESWAREVGTWVAQRVAKHKLLRGGVVVVDVVPKSAAGKILRRELRDRAKREMVTAEGGQARAKL